MNKDNLNDCPDFLQDFLFYMETIKGRSSRTVDGYYIDLRSFIRFLMKFCIGAIGSKNKPSAAISKLATLGM